MAAPSPAQSPPLSRLFEHAASAVAAVRAGRSLTEVLARCPAAVRPGTQALAFQALRGLGGALAARAVMAPKPPPPAVDGLLCTALALLWPGDEPLYAEHTVVDQAVTAARQHMPAAANFVNAVLRRFLREREALVEAACRQPEAAYQHPAWWIERVRRDWPAQWQALLAEANRHPPMVLRVNARRSTADDYVHRLGEQGRAAQALGAQAVWLKQPCNVGELPGFAEGDVSVQDLSAQRAAPLLLEGLPSGARVLDACAAPGGKTAHLLELAALDLLALDSDGQRLARVRDNLQRLHLMSAPQGPSTLAFAAGSAVATAAEPSASHGSRVRLQAADARQTATWWDGRPFDAILLDGPCTASGIVRRHPDVRWLRRPEDVTALARTQAELLEALWPLLAPGGRLLYATCSIFLAEGQQQIDAFLQRHGADGPVLDPASPGHLPGLPDNRNPLVAAAPVTGDGFYYALIRKP